ncbi:MAG: metalloprotease TldD [Gammaproteobacteria bacterium]|nr:metalloprotease TldD [Gammaproteobacteria bacterium]NNJ84061.1 metalloprotease TldD [Gammaproteobacteria bacterium]
MTDTLKLAKTLILEPAGLGEPEIQATLDRLLGHSIDTADIYFQSTRSESWMLEDGLIKEASYNIEQGAGVRAVSGEKTGFAYSDEIALPALTRAATAARAIAGRGESGKLQAWRRAEEKTLYRTDDPLLDFTEQQRVELLKAIDAEARGQDPRVTQVIVGLAGESSAMLIAGTDGTFVGDIRPLVRLNVHVIVEQNGRREQGSAGGGGRYGYGVFLDRNRGFGFAREAVRQALVNLEAIDAPAGTMAVVLGPGWPGILLHEAIGHGLEGDFNRKGSSAFAGRIGERVATEHCTVVDDGTLPERRGSLNVDDEGTPTKCTVLIEKGILTGYLQDKLNARLMGTVSTGNGRRESYAHLPMPRMTNTYLLAGEHAPEEIIGSVDKGLYAAHFGGGQVDITSGKFVFSASEAYLIEKGRITQPVKGATLIGNGPDILTKVTMLGNDLALDEGVGVCGKEGQSVPVGVGQPTLRVDALTVGGTEVG